MIDDIVSDDRPLRRDSTQHTNEEQPKIFWSVNGVYEVAGLKPWRYLVAGVATQKENPKL